MNRRSFLKRVLGGGAAALAGAAVPLGLRPDEMALVEERVDLEWRDGRLFVRNATQETIEVYGTAYGEIRAGEFHHVPDGVHVTIRNLTDRHQRVAFGVGQKHTLWWPE